MKRILVLAIPLAASGCVHFTMAQCLDALAKVQQARAAVNIAQASVDAVCAAGAASKACQKEQSIALLAKAGLDAADAAASAFCATRPGMIPAGLADPSSP